MAKGKYAARAANRLAQLDNELAGDLKAKLAAAEAERDRLACALEAERRHAASEIGRRVTERTAVERDELVAKAEALAAELKVWKSEVADELLDFLGWWSDGLIEQYGTEKILPVDIMLGDRNGPGLLHLLELLDSEGAGERLSQYFEQHTDDKIGWDRRARRRSARRIARESAAMDALLERRRRLRPKAVQSREQEA